MLCHHCKEQMFAWEGARSELLPNSRFHVYYHTGCFQQVKMARGELSLHTRRRTDIKPIESEVRPVSE
jgi:hypothetical protein